MSGTATVRPDTSPTGLVKRRIDVKFEFGQGDYGEKGTEVHTVTGLRVSSVITRAGMPGASAADIQIYGLSLSELNHLSTLGKPREHFVRNNKVTLLAGDDINGLRIAYVGIIREAWADFSAAPDVPLIIQSFAGEMDSMIPQETSSYPGAFDAVQAMRDLATRMGYAFENNGVAPVMLHNQHWPGTGRAQAEAIAAAAPFSVFIDDVENTLVIWPINGARTSAGMFETGPGKGLLGYPSYAPGSGIALRTLYNPSIRFGGKFKITGSIVSPANATWVINGLTHSLDAMMPNGRWFSDLMGYLDGFPLIPQR